MDVLLLNSIRALSSFQSAFVNSTKIFGNIQEALQNV